MQNFDYQTPTRLIFGEGVLSSLPLWRLCLPLAQSNTQTPKT